MLRIEEPLNLLYAKHPPSHTPSPGRLHIQTQQGRRKIHPVFKWVRKNELPWPNFWLSCSCEMCKSFAGGGGVKKHLSWEAGSAAFGLLHPSRTEKRLGLFSSWLVWGDAAVRFQLWKTTALHLAQHPNWMLPRSHTSGEGMHHCSPVSGATWYTTSGQGGSIPNDHGYQAHEKSKSESGAGLTIEETSS